MNANLMPPSRAGEAAQESQRTKLLGDFPAGLSRLGVFDDGHPFLLERMRANGGVDDAGIFRGRAGDKGQVFFLDLPPEKLPADVSLSGGIFGHEQYAAGVFVEPMNDAAGGHL